MTSLLLLLKLIYAYTCAAVDAYQGSIKIIGGNFSTYNSALKDEKSSKYKELANKVITGVRDLHV